MVICRSEVVRFNVASTLFTICFLPILEIISFWLKQFSVGLSLYCLTLVKHSRFKSLCNFKNTKGSQVLESFNINICQIEKNKVFLCFKAKIYKRNLIPKSFLKKFTYSFN